MASNVSPGSAATVISFLILAGLQLETRFRVGEVLAAPRHELSDEPEPELAIDSNSTASGHRCMRKLLCRRYHTWISRT